jgi:hypothetical protein
MPEHAGEKYMKKAGLILGFVPLVVYGVLAGISTTGITLALAAATVVSIIVGYADLRSRMILTWANLVLFGALLITNGVLGMTWIIPYNSILIYTSLAAVSFGSILIGKPFTLQYARNMVDKRLWDNPLFIRVNTLIAGAWGGVFLINCGLSAVALVLPNQPGHIAQLATYIILVAGIIVTIRYPEHIRKKYSTKQPA